MKRLIIALAVLAPSLAAAQQLTGVQTLLSSIGHLVSLALPIVVGLALLGFFWGVAQFIFAAGDEEKKKQGKSHMIWGIVGLFVMVSIWGLVQFLSTNLLGGNQPQTNGVTPQVQGLQ